MIDKSWQEPVGAFPYKAPSADLLAHYRHLEDATITYPKCKLILEKIISLFAIILFGTLAIPLIILCKLEALFAGERLAVIFYYYSYSEGKTIKKWKIRSVKESAVDIELAQTGDWRAWANEWSPADRMFFGNIAKKLYLDEYPQFFSVIRGQLALVGPRPLALLHAKRDMDQGNYTRNLLRGGIIGLGHVRKGTDDFGKPNFEFEYADILHRGNCIEILKTDLLIVYMAFRLMIKAGGH